MRLKEDDLERETDTGSVSCHSRSKDEQECVAVLFVLATTFIKSLNATKNVEGRYRRHFCI
jgi:hypothetical protein